LFICVRRRLACRCGDAHLLFVLLLAAQIHLQTSIERREKSEASHKQHQRNDSFHGSSSSSSSSRNCMLKWNPFVQQQIKRSKTPRKTKDDDGEEEEEDEEGKVERETIKKSFIAVHVAGCECNEKKFRSPATVNRFHLWETYIVVVVV